jgi:two-component sensor histidine kinase
VLEVISIPCNKLRIYTYDGNIAKRLASGIINAVSFSQDGSILIGKQDGLYEYRNKQIKKVKWPVKTDERVTCFAQQNGMIVTGFYGTGLILTDGKTYTTIRRKDGLPSDFINSMTFNTKGQLVVTTGNGVAIITLVPSSKKGYTIQSIPGNECLDYDTYYVSESKGILYFSSYNGLMEVKNVVVSKKGNPLVFGDIRVNGKVWNSMEVSLHYDEGNLIELFYKQNNFSSNEHVAYFYRLNKNDKWIRTTNESLVLKNLNPGDYAVEVYALNPYSGFRTDIIQKHIQIIPLIYQRIWFKILVLALLSGAIFLFVRVIIRKRDDKRKRELQFQLEITQLEARALRSQMNPHFIFNSLNSIQSFILKNDRDSAYKYLGKFSELIREILENSRNEKISIADEIHMLTNYLELERMRSDNSFNFDIVVDGRIHEHNTQIPIMVLQPVVENAIVHGVIPLEGRTGMVSIVFCSVGENTLEIIVRDNGIGRKASQELNERNNVITVQWVWKSLKNGLINN